MEDDCMHLAMATVLWHFLLKQCIEEYVLCGRML